MGPGIVGGAQVRRQLLALPLVSLVMFTGACHGGQSPSEAAASDIAAVSSPCRAAVEGTDVSTWREVAAADFTFCVPAEWRVGEHDARHGSATLKWGAGVPPRETLGQSTGPVAGPAVSRSSLDLRHFSEEIGGRLAQLFRNRYGDDKYYSGASWDSPAVWLNGASRTARETDLQLAIYRTVRFTP